MKCLFQDAPSQVATAVVLCMLAALGTDNARAAETFLDVNMKAAAKLPLPGATQISGIKVDLAADGAFAAPDQVCCLVFQKGEDKAVVRVWENKDHRYFVSTTGDDAGDGSESKPWKTVSHAIDTVMEKDKDGDVYVAGGDYWETAQITMRFKVSLYGGFDEKAGWRRDPAITQSILLPHGFRANWVDDMCQRFKDLRRPEHRVQETRIRREKFTKEINSILRMSEKGPDPAGSADTFLDGVTLFGAANTDTYQAVVVNFPEAGPSVRTIRNCIFLTGYSNGHAYLPGGHSRGLWENNIFWGGIVGHKDHCRPQTIWVGGAPMRRNLHVAPTGGDYTRVFICWGNGGLLEESQIHGGSGYSMAFQGSNGATKGKAPYRFERNLFDVDRIADPFWGTGLVLKDNEFHLRRFGFGSLLASTVLEITGNTFYTSDKATKDNIIPTGAKMVQRLGGTLNLRKDDDCTYTEPEGEGTGKPTIENNKFLPDPLPTRVPANLVDTKELDAQIKARGEDACIPPKLPATGLKAEPAGGGVVRLSWQASKDPEVVGYVLYWGTKPDSYDNHQIVNNATNAEIKDLKPGKYCFSAAAFKPAVVECWTLSNEAVADVK